MTKPGRRPTYRTYSVDREIIGDVNYVLRAIQNELRIYADISDMEKLKSIRFEMVDIPSGEYTQTVIRPVLLSKNYEYEYEDLYFTPTTRAYKIIFSRWFNQSKKEVTIDLDDYI